MPEPTILLHDYGEIPEAYGAPAFQASDTGRARIPVLLAVPHAGQSYTADLCSLMRDPDVARIKLEDRLADQLAIAIAEKTGAALLLARAPRAMVDLNRAWEDVDWTMIAGRPRDSFPASSFGQHASQRARTGLGLIPRRISGVGELWKSKIPASVLANRFVAIHQPYHARLAEMLVDLEDRWGAALLVDLHSMPSLPARLGMEPAACVVGDRFGVACNGLLTSMCLDFLPRHEIQTALNRPYAGGYVLQRHGAPAHGHHALQLEIDRARYLNPSGVNLGDGFSAITKTLAALIGNLAVLTAELGMHRKDDIWQHAAE